MSNNKENFIRADSVPTDAEIELAVGRLRPNWTRGVPRARTGGASHILQSLAHGRSHAVVLEIKRSPRRVSPSAGPERVRTRGRRFQTALQIASAVQLNSADVPSTLST